MNLFAGVHNARKLVMPKSEFVDLSLPSGNSVMKQSTVCLFVNITVAWMISNYLCFPVWKSWSVRFALGVVAVFMKALA